MNFPGKFHFGEHVQKETETFRKEEAFKLYKSYHPAEAFCLNSRQLTFFPQIINSGCYYVSSGSFRQYDIQIFNGKC